MRTIRVRTFEASIYLGLENGYTGDTIPKKDVVETIQQYQNSLIQKNGFYLSASIIDCNILLSGQNEKHLRIGFINYPKFKIDHKIFKKEVFNLAKYLMETFNQNRLVIVFTDETIMIEKDTIIDGRILNKRK